MNKALRKAIIAGNWKMNKNRKEAAELINALKPIAADKTCGVIICVPFTNLETALSLTEGTNTLYGVTDYPTDYRKEAGRAPVRIGA